MVSTSYDDVWTVVLDIMGEDRKLLPFENDDIYSEIHNGIRNYNIHTDNNKINYSDDDELIISNKGKLDDIEIKLLALFIKQNIYQCKLERFQNVYQYDLTEVKSKFYKDQSTVRESTLSKVEKEIEQLISYNKSYDFN